MNTNIYVFCLFILLVQTVSTLRLFKCKRYRINPYPEKYYSNGSVGGGYKGNPYIVPTDSYYRSAIGILALVESSPDIYNLSTSVSSYAQDYLIRIVNNRPSYTVHNYYNNPNNVSKNLSAPNESLVTCSKYETKGRCAPNTFPMCFVNGTIMCVTHATYTTPCSSNASLACVISAMPPECRPRVGIFVTTRIQVPCISNVTVNINESLERFCVTAIAIPKIPQFSGIGSYLTFLASVLGEPLLSNDVSTNDATTVVSSNSKKGAI